MLKRLHNEVFYCFMTARIYTLYLNSFILRSSSVHRKFDLYSLGWVPSCILLELLEKLLVC